MHQFAAIAILIQTALCQQMGQFLVATSKSHDPDLAQTVILLVHYDDKDGAIGLIVNRRTDVPISRVFPELKRSDPMYFGGPIRLGVRALLRSRTKPESAEHIFGDVYMVKEPKGPRVYAGYTGWSVQQLRDELALGLWTIRPGDARIVFDSDPGSVWSRMIKP
jgi:putative transcriptional regulator